MKRNSILVYWSLLFENFPKLVLGTPVPKTLKLDHKIVSILFKVMREIYFT